jgi:PAS domain S-box-containing protein
VTNKQVPGGARFAAFLEMVPDAIVGVDGEGTIVFVNPEAARLFGYRCEELINKPIDLLLARSFRTTVLRQGSITARDPRRGSRAAPMHLIAHRKDGSTFPGELLMTSTRMAGRFIVMAALRDVSARTPENANFRGVLEAAHDASVAVDRGGLIALVNEEAEELFGYTSGELIDQPVDVLVPQPRPRPSLRKRSRQIHGHGTLQTGPGAPLEGRRKDGSEFPLEISLSAIETDEGPLVSAALRDASDRVETRREQGRAEVQRERDVLESRLHQSHRLESLGQLAGGVAHDFNNLLAAILIYVGFVSEEVAAELETRPADARVRLTAVLSDVAQIGAAADRAAGLTHQLLAFARREVRNLEILDINDVVAEVESLLCRTIGEHVELITRGSRDLRSVRADRGQIEQILLNLAVNGRDAMSNGGTLTVATSNFTVNDEYASSHPLVEAGPYVRLRVTDTGAGMDAETLERAFEPFFSTKPKNKGTGLGLATVYGIVSQTAGMVELTSKVGVGTSVTILLPSVAAAVTDTKPDRPRRTIRHTAGETVLVVEDEELVLDVASRILTNQGYHVLRARSGAEALKAIARHAGRIDLLLTDVVMPGATGKEVAETVSAARPGIRVLFMSGYQESVIASHGVIDQGIRLLSKPFKAPDLLTHVRASLDA